jgi:hypothetical protein
MLTELDRMFAGLRDSPLDRSLDQLEARVWGRIESAAIKAAPHQTAWRWRAGLAAVMLTLGVFAGGAAATRPESDFAPFAVHAAYAPSTLLGDDR